MSIFHFLNLLLVILTKFLLRIWHTLFSPLFGNNCRFHPTCSCYAIEALEKHGFLKGIFLTAKRVLKCNSLFDGGIDRVP